MDGRMAGAFRTIPYGVYVLTVRQGPLLLPLIVSWVSQVSFSPARLMVALRHNRRAVAALRASGAFSLSLLSREQKSLVARLKAATRSEQAEELWEPGDSLRAPGLRDCLAGWGCRLCSTVDAGDHFIFLGEVETVFGHQKGLPLTTLDLEKTYIGEF